MKLLFCLLVFVVVSGFQCSSDYFYSDPNDPGLSEFSDHGYQQVSSYINDDPWVGASQAYSHFNLASDSFYTYSQYIWLQATAAAQDTLHFSWSGRFGVTQSDFVYTYQWQSNNVVTLSIPVPKNFTIREFYALRGKRFPDAGTPVSISLGNGVADQSTTLDGTGKIYLVSIKTMGEASEFQMTGLYEGNIGDSIHITKGRFDSRFYTYEHNLPD